MIIATACVAAFIATLSAVAIARPLNWPRTRRPTFFFFPLAFLSVLTGGLWIMPTGPELYGAPFVPMIVMGMVCAMWFVTLVRPRKPEEVHFGATYWALILTLAATVVIWFLV